MEISIVRADALAFRADVLVLKYAQARYGVDAQVVRRLDGQPGRPCSRRPPAPGRRRQSRRIARADRRQGRSLPRRRAPGQFGYAEIRAFARDSLKALAEKVPDAAHVAMTLHGVGFGLDETEAFRSQLAGLIEAWQSGEGPPGLRRMSILEHNARRGERLRSQLDEILPNGLEAMSGQSTARSKSVLQTDALRTAGAGSRGKAHVFVAMPFAKEFDDRFHYGINKAIQTAGYLCERADMSSFTGDVLMWVKERIDSAALVVADLSGGNANVYLEVGYAWGKGLPTVLVGERAEGLALRRSRPALPHLRQQHPAPRRAPDARIAEALGPKAMRWASPAAAKDPAGSGSAGSAGRLRATAPLRRPPG